MTRTDFTVNVDAFLALNKFEVDEETPHIEVDLDGSDEEFEKLIMVCPAALSRKDANGSKRFDYAGCLECGTCRAICGSTIIMKWTNPEPSMGVEYRFG